MWLSLALGYLRCSMRFSTSSFIQVLLNSSPFFNIFWKGRQTKRRTVLNRRNTRQLRESQLFHMSRFITKISSNQDDPASWFNRKKQQRTFGSLFGYKIICLHGWYYHILYIKWTFHRFKTSLWFPFNSKPQTKNR